MSSRRFGGGDDVPAVFRGGNIKFPVGRLIAILIVVCIGGTALLAGFTAVQRVDPGFTAIVVDYAVGTTSGITRYTQAPTGSFFLINPLTQRVAKYPLAQQTLSMVRRQLEG